MKKTVLLILLNIFLISSVHAQTNDKEKHLNIKEENITSQPYKVELIDNITPQTQNSISIKVANDVHLHKLKVGNKILFTQPSNINLVNSNKIPAGTKYSATVVQKELNKIKIIINEIIFTDTKNYIILSTPKDIQPLKTISAERILGKNATVNGIFKLGTEISSVNIAQRGIKSEPDTTTAVGICILIKTGAHTLNAGTPVNITFVKNINPKIQLLK